MLKVLRPLLSPYHFEGAILVCLFHERRDTILKSLPTKQPNARFQLSGKLKEIIEKSPSINYK
jgi:hypothetical protein